MPHASLSSALPPRVGRARRRRLTRRAFLGLLPAVAVAVAGGAAFVTTRRHRLAVREGGPPSLTISSRPAGATLVVDGRVRGHTPARLDLAAGTHHLLLERADAIPTARDLSLRAQEVRQLAVTLWRRQPAIEPLRPPLPGSTIAAADFLADGTVALRIALPPGDRSQLWRRDAAGRLTQLGPRQAAGPLAAAPDAHSVAALAPAAPSAGSWEGHSSLREVWTCRADGSGARRRYALPASDDTGQLTSFSWSPTGRALLLAVQGAGGDAASTQLRRLDLATGSTRTLLALPSDLAPGSFLWSPDAEQVAFLTQAGSLVSLCLLTVSAARFRYVADLGPGDAALAAPPLAWSPRSEALVYAAPVRVAARGLGGLLFGAPTASALFHTAVTDTQSTRLRNSFGAWPVWRPDGSLLALAPSPHGGGLVLHLVDPVTGRDQPLGPIRLPAGDPMALRWDAAQRQALLLGGRADALDASLLSFAPEAVA